MANRFYDDLATSVDTTAFMVGYVREHFADVLGPHADLLDQPGGLDQIAQMIRSGQLKGRSRSA